MTTLGRLSTNSGEENSHNVTIRKMSKAEKPKMAGHGLSIYDLGLKGDTGSLFVDSILSQTETEEVERMLEMEGLITDGYGIEGRTTSTQMTRETRWNASLGLSPIATDSPNGGAERNTSQIGFGKNRFSALLDGVEDWNHSNFESKKIQGDKNSEFEPDVKDVIDSDIDNERRIDGTCKVSKTGNEGTSTSGSNVTNVAPRGDSATAGKGLGNSHDNQPSNEGGAVEGDSGRSIGDVNNDGEVGGEDGSEVEEKEGDSSEGGVDSDEEHLDLHVVNKRLKELNGKTGNMEKSLSELRKSLEFSQKEIDTLKEDNARLREKVADNQLEGERTQFQVNKVEEKADKLETAGKSKNLSLEGLPEVRGSRENVEKTVWDMFDQLNLGRGFELDACYRLGSYNQNGTRPIVVSFLKQSDRDLVYSRRMELNNTNNYKNIWINEDLGAASKRKRNMIRLITREAKIQGIDHRSGKYAIHVDKVKYEEGNLDDLPPALHPTSIKQVQVDKDTIAYQSENAPFSNFYPVSITMGRYKFNSAEQAYQFLRAKTLNKLLVAMRIYLSRSAYDIKRMAEDLGTSDDWEAKKMEVMYVILRRKFEQNPDLLRTLLRSGNCELVEATPNREWGCGATLSSNVLKRHTWPGENKHGKILMTVREELRARTKTG